MKTKHTLQLKVFINLVLGIGLVVYLGMIAWTNYRGVKTTILKGFDRRLESISSSSAYFIDGSEHEAILQSMSEENPLYQKYAKEMTRVMEEAGLTYHYTIILPRENTLTYVLDGTVGENHSTLGTEEEVDPEEWTRLHDVLITGKPTQSKVKQFELWGQLKVGSAPIRNQSGEIVGIAGADVNISIIDKKSRIALLRVLGLVFLGLLIAGIIASWIARELGAPIDLLKRAILRMAAGDYSNPVKPQGPKELIRLGKAFENARANLQTMLQSLEQDSRAYDRLRECSLLKQLLLGEYSGAEDTTTARYGFQVFLAAKADGIDISGAVRHRNTGIMWVGETKLSQLPAAWLKSDISTICFHLLLEHGTNIEKIEAGLKSLMEGVVSHFILFDILGGRLSSVQGTNASALPLLRLSSSSSRGQDSELAIFSTEKDASSLGRFAVFESEADRFPETGVEFVLSPEASSSDSVVIVRRNLKLAEVAASQKPQAAFTNGGIAHADR